jgi:hypothetical protein
MLSGDPRIHLILRLVYDAHKRGQIPADAGVDFVSRVELTDRGLRMGRGMRQGTWLSVLPRSALSTALSALLGEPSGRWAGGAGDTYDFPVGSGSATGKAVASSAVGLALLATVGVGWVSVPRGPGLRTARAMVNDFPCGSGFTLLGSTGGPFQPLSVTSASFLGSIHEALLRMETRFLLLECAFGRDRPPEQLFAIPRAQVEARVASLVGPTDLSTFYPPPKR